MRYDNPLKDGYNYVSSKIGGENAGNIDLTLKEILYVIKNGRKQSFAMSAMRGKDSTTKELELVGQLLGQGKNQEAVAQVEKIKDIHLKLINDNFNFAGLDDFLPQEFLSFEAKRKVKDSLIFFTHNKFESLSKSVSNFRLDGNNFPCEENNYSIHGEKGELFSLKGFGEVFSTYAYSHIVKELGLGVDVLDLSSEDGKIKKPKVDSSKQKTIDNIDRILMDSGSGKLNEILKAAGIEEVTLNEEKEFDAFIDLIDLFKQKIKDIIYSENNVTFTPGYVGGIEGGIGNTFKLGYTEAIQFALGVAFQEIIGNVLCEVQKSTAVKTTDPRALSDEKKAIIVNLLSYISGKEITGLRGGDAKFLNSLAFHHRVIRSMMHMIVHNPTEENNGTLFTKKGDINSNGVQVMPFKNNVTYVAISGLHMCKGFCAKALNIVKDFVSFELIVSSDTEIGFTVNESEGGNNKELINRLLYRINQEVLGGMNDSYDFSKVEYNKSLIFFVGQNLSGHPGIVSDISSVFKDLGVDIEIISQGILQRALIIGIDSSSTQKSVKALHKRLFED